MHRDRSRIIIEGFILAFGAIGIIVSISVIILMLSYRRQYPIDASTILIFNTYFAITLNCMAVFDMITRSLHGNLHVSSNFDGWWCQLRAYLLQMALASIYYSYFLQAIYRFFRIVLYLHRQLQKFRFILMLIILQWIWVAISLLPPTFLGFVQYLPDDYYCQIPLTNLFVTIYATLVIYNIPIMGTGICYAFLIYHIKHSNNLTNRVNRQRANQRDLMVLRRIIYVISLLLVLFLPSGILWLDYIRTGYLQPLIYHFQWLSYSLLLTLVSIVSVFLTPQLYQLLKLVWRKHRRIQPVVVLIQANGRLAHNTET